MSKLPRNRGIGYRRVRNADLVGFLAFEHLEDLFCLLLRGVHLACRLPGGLLVDDGVSVSGEWWRVAEEGSVEGCLLLFGCLAVWLFGCLAAL